MLRLRRFPFYSRIVSGVPDGPSSDAASTTNQRRSRSKPRRGLHLEGLERREMLDDNGLIPLRDAHLTLSFAPDDTLIAGSPSSMFALAGSLGEGDDWQLRMADAFQTWSNETNGDIGVVSDDGSPFGTPGASRRDERFGDVRIGARPLADGVAAISMPLTREASGTWLGDVVFNANYPFSSLDDLFAVAVHEAGNVFGLIDNDDPESPLHSVDIPTSTVPTPADLTDLRRLYGPRVPDPHEQQASDGEPTQVDNNDWTRSTSLKPQKVRGGEEGTAPSVAYGDLQDLTDRDFYRFRVPGDYNGPISIRVHTAGISLLNPRVTLFNESLEVLQVVVDNEAFGHHLLGQIADAQSDQEFYIQVDSIDPSLHAVGGYAVVVSLELMNQVPEEHVATIIDGRYRDVNQEQLDRLVTSDGDVLDDDQHGNDEPADATEITASEDIENQTRYETVGSIETEADTDFYKFQAPQGMSSLISVMYVEVNTLQWGRLIPQVSVLDEDRLPLLSTVLVNTGGEVLLQVEGIQEGKEYFVSVAAESSVAFHTGDYRLSIHFGETPVEQRELVSTTLVDQFNRHEHSFFVATAQLMQFIMTLPEPESAPTHIVVTTVRNAGGEVQTRFAATPGASRSSATMLLLPGEYQLSTEVWQLADNSAPFAIDYLLRANQLSDTLVVGLIDPNDQPFNCDDPEMQGVFCYPNGTIDPSPFYWTGDFLPSQFPSGIDGWQFHTLLQADWWAWYLEQTQELPPPIAPADTYQTNVNSPIRRDATNGVLGNDSASDSIPMIAILSAGPQHGQLELRLDGSFVYTPDAGYTGSDTFSYQAYDYRQPSEITTVGLEVFGSGDFSFDGSLDANDINLLAAAIRTNDTDVRFDITGDGILDRDDYTTFLSSVIQVSPGDANLDGFVDTNDLNTWDAFRFRGGSLWEQGDFDGDGMTDGTDFGIWLRYRFQGPSGTQRTTVGRRPRQA